jgi:hypothetical protein
MAKAKQAAAADSSTEFLGTLNELNKLAARTDLTKVQAGAMSKGGAMAKGGAVGAQGLDVCKVYGKVRPFLDIIIRIPFIPAKAKDAIKLLMSALDVMCPR